MTTKLTNESKPADTSTRRGFLRQSTAAVAASALSLSQLSIARAAHTFGEDTIRLGLVGCGDRGTGAVAQAMNTAGSTKLVAVADVFASRVQECLRNLGRDYADKLDVARERQFVGLDGFEGVLASDIDLVILATPPGFRPLHFERAIAANKHVFMEKPVAVDAVGVRRVLDAARLAKTRELAVAVGLQRRHEPRYIETVQRLQDGAIGEILALRVYWNSDGVWTRNRKPEQTEMEYQLDNWYYFNWLCGDHIVEQHIHNLDVGNWVKGRYPISATGMGGRQVRTGIDQGQIFDHHSVEFTFDDGCKMFSQCCHIPGCESHVAEYAHGSQGWADISAARIYDAKNGVVWEFGEGGGNGHQQEHHDLFRAETR